MTSPNDGPNWDEVRFLIMVDFEGDRFVRVFEKHPTLTFNEYWCSPNSPPKFMGVNEPPEDDELKELSGEEARQAMQRYLVGL